MTTLTSRSTRTTARTLIAVSALAATAVAAAPAGAAPVAVQSGALTWSVPRETSPYTLAGYASSIGTGSVDATAPATGASITPTSVPAAGAGVTYPFQFPVATAGAGSYDPDAKTGSINFQGTLTFTAHGSTFLSVVNPSVVFDAPQSARVVANGVASPAMGATDPTPVTYGAASPARQTVFALNASAAVTTTNPDGSYTISNLIPSGTPQSAPTSFISSNAAFDGVRTFFGIARPNQGFSITFAAAATVSTPTPTATPTPTPTPTPTASPYAPQVVPATPTPTVTPTATPVATVPAVVLYTTTFKIKSKPFGAKKVNVSIRKSGKGQKTIGKGTLQGTTLKIKLPKGTKLKGKYVLSRTSGAKKLPKTATVTVG